MDWFRAWATKFEWTSAQLFGDGKLDKEPRMALELKLGLG